MSRTKTKLVFVIVFWLFLACLLSVVGITYGRYHSTIGTGPLNFTAASVNSISVYGGKLSEDNMSSQWAELSSGWSQGEKIANWEFFVTNGSNVDEYAQRDQSFNVEVISGLGSDDLVVELTYTTDDGSIVSIKSQTTQIVEGSALHSSYGPGFVHRFFDSEGKELSFILEGESFNYRNLVLTVSESDQPSLIDLKITGEYVNQSAQ